MIRIFPSAHIVAPLIFLVAAALASGCASVKPWDRDLMAKPQMALDPHPLQSRLRSHVFESREAAAGGESAGGGGCGCN